MFETTAFEFWIGVSFVLAQAADRQWRDERPSLTQQVDLSNNSGHATPGDLHTRPELSSFQRVLDCELAKAEDWDDEGTILI